MRIDNFDWKPLELPTPRVDRVVCRLERTFGDRLRREVDQQKRTQLGARVVKSAQLTEFWFVLRTVQLSSTARWPYSELDEDRVWVLDAEVNSWWLLGARQMRVKLPFHRTTRRSEVCIQRGINKHLSRRATMVIADHMGDIEPDVGERVNVHCW